jgi:hypothetical protein
MSKHIPGPWRHKHLVGKIYEIRNDDGFLVAAVTGEANARLIVKTPEMYERLEELNAHIIEFLNETENDEYIDTGDILDFLNAILNNNTRLLYTIDSPNA